MREQIEVLADAMSFEIENDTLGKETGPRYMRLRHSEAPQSKEWAIIVYPDDDFSTIAARLGENLIKVGKYLKIQEIMKV